MNKILTIGIPTYKRVNEVLVLVRFIIENNLHSSVDILLIDDGPSLELTEKVLPFLDKINFIQHKVNQGYANTFCELIENCQTEYIIITSDDDDIIPENLVHLIRFLETDKPDFVSTQWLRNDFVHRGKKKNAPIKISEVGQASNHAPGLVYKKHACVSLMAFLKKQIADKCQATFFYPQVILLYLLLLNNKKCMWLALPIISEGFALPTALSDNSGNNYFSFNGRWNVFIGFLNCFDNMEDFILIENIGKLQLIKIHYNQEAFKRFYSIVKHSYFEKSDVFLAGALFEALKKPFHSIKILFQFITNKLKRLG